MDKQKLENLKDSLEGVLLIFSKWEIEKDEFLIETCITNMDAEFEIHEKNFSFFIWRRL